MLARQADETRPLSLKNTDNKIVCGVTNYGIRGVLMRSTTRWQRGFVPRRQIVDSIADIHVGGRLFAMQASDECGVCNAPWLATLGPVCRMLIMVFFDSAAAFPSLHREWMFKCMRWRRLPPGFVIVVAGLYDDAWAVSADEGGVVPLRGRRLARLSAQRHAVRDDLFVMWMAREVQRERQGTLRACADDVGSSLRALALLKELHPLFQAASDAANLLQDVEVQCRADLASDGRAIVVDTAVVEGEHWPVKGLPGPRVRHLLGL